MKYAHILALFCALGCSQDGGPGVTDNQERKAPASVTLENFVYVAGGCPMEHPLMCLPGKDYPEGREMAFRDPESGEFVHAVFPEAAAAPAVTM